MIEVHAYNPQWKHDFGILRDQLLPVVSHISTRIEHVGSTSVEGLWAKPIIDIDIIIDSRNQLAEAVSALATLGYKHVGDLGIEDREVFKHDGAQIQHHLYVCIDGSVSLRNHLLLRDHLRSNPGDREAYSLIKQNLVTTFRDDIDGYIDGKTAFIVSVLGQYDLDREALLSIKQANEKSGGSKQS